MTEYARIVDGKVERTYEITAEQYAALVANGKAAYLRLWVVDPDPIPSATQALVVGPIVITATEARQTWTLRDKTQAELDADANRSEAAQIKAAITELTTDIQAYNPNPDMTGTQAQVLVKIDARLKDLERQQRRNNRIVRYYLRSLA